jgi:hypothetical protein
MNWELRYMVVCAIDAFATRHILGAAMGVGARPDDTVVGL